MRRFCRRGAAIGALSTVGLLMALPGVSDAQPVGMPGDPPLTKAAVDPAPTPQLVVATRPAAPKPYIVVAGDTLWALGVRSHRTWAAWAGFNHLANPDLITVGEALWPPPPTYEPPPTPLPPVSLEKASSGSVRPQAAVQAQSYQTAVSTGSGGWSGPWACIAQHESGGNPAENTGNGYYGGLQFSLSTWAAYGGVGNPANASIAEQEAVAARTLAGSGWGAWPNTSVACGY
jgi:LysM repeat protein